MSYQNWDSVDDNNENENEQSDDVDWAGRDGVIFLIDATESMFREDLVQDQNGTSEMFFRKALKCCHTTMLKKIMGSEKDLIAVVLFGTAKKENHLNLNHLYVLQTLEQPNVEKIKALDTMIKSDSCGNFNNLYGHSDNYVLQDVLWLCQSIFSNCELKLGMQRILLFTANEDPHAGNRIEKQRALDRASDLCGLNISLELLPMGRDFDVNVFYKELVETAMGEDYAEHALGRYAQNIEELLLQVCRYSHKKRSVGRLLLYLGPKLAVGVGIYSMLRNRPMPNRIWLERSTNATITSSTNYFNADSGEVVLPMDVLKCRSFGGQKVIFNPEETKVPPLLAPGFYLKGFLPKESVKLEYHYQKPFFIFPDDNLVKGSRKVFAALLKRCVHKGKVFLCWGITRRGAHPKLFAFFPQEEKLNTETGAQDVPGGFHAYPLPVSAQIRKLEVETMTDASESQIDYMTNLISKLTFRYNVHNFQNPVLQTLWAGIEALALDLPKARDIEDNTKPKHALIKRKLDELGVDFEEVFCAKDFIKSEQKSVPKRTAGTEARYGKVKQVKIEDVDVEDLARDGKVGNLKVDQLKAYLQSRGLKVTGKKKGELVEMVYESLSIEH